MPSNWRDRKEAYPEMKSAFRVADWQFQSPPVTWQQNQRENFTALPSLSPNSLAPVCKALSKDLEWDISMRKTNASGA
ncbi:hypothetical protein SKAU_G00231950 [Synaphobranchus kaupii]|uniref:Uncharacterized protein n=1 Tax=Synaphobranchus kaupii TaxID=118154 RepID=A0A9Q1F685_SYNKA|nr:hypothetical protein SKAU_G00231950 [Synaphobranchus kaupii]